MDGTLENRQISATFSYIALATYCTECYLTQACFFNVWPTTSANFFAQILSLATNSLSLAENSLSLVNKSVMSISEILSLGKNLLEFSEKSLSLVKTLSLFGL